MSQGSCRLGLWHVLVTWNDETVHQIRFSRTGLPGGVPIQISRYLAGKGQSFSPLTSPLLSLASVYGDIYRIVHAIPYGYTRTYGEVACMAGTSPRVVGQAMKRNTTPLIIPCHRVIGSGGIGGFTPDIWIKEELLRMESEMMNLPGFPGGDSQLPGLQ